MKCLTTLLRQLLMVMVLFVLVPRSGTAQISGPMWATDEDNLAIAVFIGNSGVDGLDVFDLGPFTSPSAFWSINFLQVVHRDRFATGSTADQLEISGEVQHLGGPALFFSLLFNTPAEIAAGILSTGTAQAHGVGAVDRLAVQVEVEADPNQLDILGYGIGIGAAHSVTPEPASMLLLGSGLAGISVALRRRRSRSKGES